MTGLNKADDGIEQFLKSLDDHGIPHPEEVLIDGKLHRFPTSDKSSDDAGWFILYPGPMLAGAFGDWRSGVSETFAWKNGREYTAAEKRAFGEYMRAAKSIIAQERQAARAEAGARALRIWEDASTSTGHAYCKAKGIPAEYFRARNDLLVCPVYVENELSSLQFIAADGTKKFLRGGATKGGCWLIGTPVAGKPIAIAEGVATAISIHEASGWPVYVCYTAGNLAPVAEQVRREHPTSKVVICADDDWKTEGNPGITAAKDAATRIGATVAIPPRTDGTDWNDANLAGHDISALLQQSILRGDLCRLQIESLRAAPQKVEVLVEGLLPRSAAVLLVGIGGAGKTSMLLSLACAVATGESWCGRNVSRGKTMLVTAEDRATRLTSRLQSYLRSPVCPYKDWHLQDIADNLSFYDLSHHHNYLVTERDSLPALTTNFNDLRMAITGHDLVILDPAALFVADENNNALMAALMRELNGLADDHGCTIIFSSHTSKQSARDGLADAHAARGASALGDNGRGTFVLRDAGKDDDCPLRDELAEARKLLGEDCEIVVLENPRQSLIKRSDPLWFVRGAGGAILPLGAGKRRSVDEKRLERHGLAYDAILATLADGRDYNRGAIKSILNDVGGRREYQEIIEDLIDSGKVEEVTIRPPGKGRPSKVLRLVK